MKLKNSVTAQNMRMMFYDLPEDFTTCGAKKSQSYGSISSLSRLLLEQTGRGTVEENSFR